MFMFSQLVYVFFFFFFQAEDGIRDLTVTGVQTCALPIWARDALGLGRPADALARAARPTVLVRERPQRAGPAADERRQARVPRRALSRTPRRLCALPDARSEARRRERPPGQARSALP